MRHNPAKLVTLILGGGCVVLLAVAALQFAGIGGGVKRASADEFPPPDGDGVPVDAGVELAEMAAEESYGLVSAKPLFNEDRRPFDGSTEILDPNVGPDGTPLDEPPTELEATVAGIIITPEKRIVMLRDNKTSQTMSLREGMPLEGELASWSVGQIEPRKVSFDGQGGSEAELELLVHTQALPGGRSPARPANNRRNRNRAAKNANDNENGKADNESRAEEIRRKVAERRAQMRADAARRRQQQEDNDDEN